MKQRNTNCERNKLRLLIWTKVKFYSSKNLFKLIKQKEGFETNSRRLNRLIPINERKDKLKQKSGQKSRSKIIAENPGKRKTDEQANERTFAVCG